MSYIRLLSAAVAVAAGAVMFAACEVPIEDPELDVVLFAPAEVPGYDRSCSGGHGCVFGPAWSDDVDVDGGHNGCDTRNDILARDLTQVEVKPGTHSCVVMAGLLADPYSGEQIQFTKAEATAVNIDHIFPLSAAWDRGASGWTLARRRDFANDPANLLATSASINKSKSDKMPGDWFPATGRCVYARQFLKVAKKYDLVVTSGEYRWANNQDCSTGN